MAHGKSVSKTERRVALMISAQGELKQTAEFLAESLRAIGLYADELNTENLHTSAVGVQAEGVRLAMAGQACRAVCERLSVALQLAADANAGAQ